MLNRTRLFAEVSWTLRAIILQTAVSREALLETETNLSIAA